MLNGNIDGILSYCWKHITQRYSISQKKIKRAMMTARNKILLLMKIIQNIVFIYYKCYFFNYCPSIPSIFVVDLRNKHDVVMRQHIYIYILYAKEILRSDHRSFINHLRTDIYPCIRSNSVSTQLIKLSIHKEC